MLQITPQMRILIAVEPIDGRKGLDSLAQMCREKLAEDPFSVCLFIFRNRSRKSIRLFIYDGQGFWLAQKRLSQGTFRWWPKGDVASQEILAYQAQMLLAAGDPAARCAPQWRPVCPQPASGRSGDASFDTRRGYGGASRPLVRCSSVSL